jgi:DNA-binding MarR family transcriptional regulator
MEITLKQAAVMAAILAGQPATFREIAEATTNLVPQVNINQFIERLIARGWVRKSKDSQGRVSLSLTAEGKKALAEAKKFGKEFLT